MIYDAPEEDWPQNTSKLQQLLLTPDVMNSRNKAQGKSLVINNKFNTEVHTPRSTIYVPRSKINFSRPATFSRINKPTGVKPVLSRRTDNYGKDKRKFNSLAATPQEVSWRQLFTKENTNTTMTGTAGLSFDMERRSNKAIIITKN